VSQLGLDTAPPPYPTGVVWKAQVRKSPLNTSVKIGVIIPDMNPDLFFDNVRWQARGNYLPKPGDDVLVVFDNQKEPWVIGWWPKVRAPIIYSGAISDGPPAAPVDDDIWIASDVAAGVSWQFQYNGASVSPYKWEFIGGAAIYVQGTSPTLTGSVPRAGDYEVAWSVDCNSGGTWSIIVTASSGSIVGNSGSSYVTLTAGGISVNSLRNRLTGRAKVTGIASGGTLTYAITGATAVNSAEFAITPARIS
jgi:hypothetical protein